MRDALLIFYTSVALVSSSSASPRMDIEESAVLDQEVIRLRDPDAWQSQKIAPVTEIDRGNQRTDGRCRITPHRTGRRVYRLCRDAGRRIGRRFLTTHSTASSWDSL